MKHLHASWTVKIERDMPSSTDYSSLKKIDEFSGMRSVTLARLNVTFSTCRGTY